MLIYTTLIDSPDDRTKFEQLYETYKNLMYHTAYQLVRNHHDAEDCVHQAFLSMIDHLDKLRRINSPQTASFLVITTEHKAIDLLRRRQRTQTLELDEENCGVVIPAIEENGLADAIAKLPAAYRQVLLLRFDNGYTDREIAKFLGITPSGVRKRIGRARAALADILEKEGIEL